MRERGGDDDDEMNMLHDLLDLVVLIYLKKSGLHSIFVR